MSKISAALLVGLGASLLVAPPASAGHCGAGVSDEVCVEGQDSGFSVDGVTARPASGGGGSSGSGQGGQAGPVVRKETRLAPTCTGNSVNETGVLCGAAVNTCPVPGEVRFWKWQRTFNEQTDAWGRWTLVDTVCLGADDPAVDPAAVIPAIVQRDFQRVVVLKGAADVTPKPDTLVNVVTKFRTDAPPSYDIPLSILGQSVVITAKAEKYTWYFGDGQSAVSDAPGGYIEHMYRKAATRQVYVVITWSGTFTVNGGARQPISGTVSTTGTPADVNVRQARSELVRD